MIPILYKANETNYNHNGLGKLNEVLENKVTELLNGEFDLFIEYPVNGKLYSEIKDSVLIKAKPNRKDEPHVFRIYEHEVDTVTQTVLISARSNTFDLAGNMVKDLTISDQTPQEAMNLMKNNLIEPIDFTFVSDITTRSSTRWTRRNPLNCIAGEQGSLLQYWGGEIKRGNKWIWLYRRRGNDNVTTIRYGKNLEGLRATYSIKGLVTAIMPFMTLRSTDGQERTIVGNVVKSQHFNKYPIPHYDAVEFTEDDGVTDLASLNRVAGRYFANHPGKDTPSIKMDVRLLDLSHSKEYSKFKDLEEVEIGDTLTVYAKKYQVNITAKVNKVVYNGLTDENEQLEIGATRLSNYDEYRELVDRTVKPVKELVNLVQVAANGKNKIYRGVDEPTEGLLEGDLWYKPIGDGDIELYIYNGYSWGDPVQSTADLKKVQKAVEEAQKGIEEYKNNIDASIDDLNTTIGNTFTSLESTINQLSSISEQTRLSAEAAQAQSLTALTDAQKAKENANDALTAARQGLSVLEGVESSISTIDYEIDELNGSLSLKASQTDMNKLTGKVDQHTFDIQVNANGLKTKAAQSTVDTLSGTVTTLSGELTVQAGLLKSKIGMTEVNGAIGNLEIGERNLVLKSDEKKKSSNYNFAQYTLSTPWESGIDYYIVLKAKASTTKSHIGAYANSGSYVLGSLTYDSKYDVWRGVARTIHSTTVLYLFQFPRDDALMEVEWIKVVKGTKTSFDWSQAPEDIQGQFKSMETDIEQTASAIKLKADQTTVDTLSGSVSSLSSQLTVQAGQISGKVSMTEVNTAIDDIKIGGRNLIVKSTAKEGYLNSAGIRTVQSDWRTTDFIEVVPGTKYIVSGYRNLGNAPSTTFYAENKGFIQGIANGNSGGIPANDKRRIVTAPGNAKYMIFSFMTADINTIKLEKGIHVTDWTPAPEDMATTTFVESEVKQTATEISGTISSLSGEVSIQKQTLTSFTQSLIDPNTGRLVKAEQNLDGLQNTVSNKADQTQVTTLANGFSVLSKQTIQNKVNIEADGFVLWSDWSRGSEISSYNISGEGFAVQQAVNNNTQGGNNRVWYSKESGFLTPGVTYTVTIIINSDAENREFSMGQGNNPGNQRFKLTTTPTKYSFVFEAVNTNTFSVYFHNAGAYRIRNVTVVEGGGASQSQLSVLTNQIDMAVREGDVIGRINIQAGRNLIQNKQIIMDAETVTFTGKAFIPDAAITTMSADKITAGVIDFTEITGININANSITTGTLGGANMDVNLNNSSIELRDPSTQNKLTLVQGRISFSNGTQGRNLLYHEEGLISRPLSGNLGTNKNSMFRLEGGGFGSYQYLQFSEGGSNGRQQRLEAVGDKMSVQVHPGGRFEVRSYGESFADMKAYSYESHHSSGNWLKMVADRIETPGDGRARNIYLKPNGTGIVSISDQNGNNYYNIRASTFLNASSRKLKTNIEESAQGALKVLNALTIVEYNLKSDLQIGVENRQIGLIAEDSLQVASADGESIDTYRLLSYNTKAIQELSSLQETLEQKLEGRLFNQESELFTVKSELAQVKSELKEVQKQLNELKGAA